MGFRVLGLAVIMVSTGMSANAGSCTATAHCYTYENGVHVLRGKHLPAVSQQAFALQQEQARLEQQARELAAANRLTTALRQQNAEITALRSQVTTLGAQRAQQRPRRRTYYGNPAFFGRNGFIGNRYHGGGTIQLPRRTRRSGQVRQSHRGK